MRNRNFSFLLRRCHFSPTADCHGFVQSVQDLKCLKEIDFNTETYAVDLQFAQFAIPALQTMVGKIAISFRHVFFCTLCNHGPTITSFLLPISTCNIYFTQVFKMTTLENQYFSDLNQLKHLNKIIMPIKCSSNNVISIIIIINFSTHHDNDSIHEPFKP